MTKNIDGALYRLREFHPRRPDMPLVVSFKRFESFTDRGGTLQEKTWYEHVGNGGDSCAGMSQEVLLACRRNDFIEPVPTPVLTSLVVADAKEHIRSVEDADVLASLEAEESANKNRTSVLSAIQDRRDALSEEN